RDKKWPPAGRCAGGRPSCARGRASHTATCGGRRSCLPSRATRAEAGQLTCDERDFQPGELFDRLEVFLPAEDEARPGGLEQFEKNQQTVSEKISYEWPTRESIADEVVAIGRRGGGYKDGEGPGPLMPPESQRERYRDVVVGIFHR